MARRWLPVGLAVSLALAACNKDGSVGAASMPGHPRPQQRASSNDGTDSKLPRAGYLFDPRVKRRVVPQVDRA